MWVTLPTNFYFFIFVRYGETSTGLGLCFTKQCLEHHNGSIWFKSIEGTGTKFYISL